MMVVCRKDSHGFVQFIKGDHSDDGLDTLLTEMSKTEATTLVSALELSDFDQLFRSIFIPPHVASRIEGKARHRFEEAKSKALSILQMSGFIDGLPDTPPWGFPKGKLTPEKQR
eukprot:TRINITY_DN19406_c0_g1_i1.p1 TRINITY_DN19406_c0_g1~~TRINITY_DN19406_c0_g1_i1.p1  ORF type:complete len:114 (+),score=8.95 TRINITY_DN19406_c0_g1_i1:173-514(+)